MIQHSTASGRELLESATLTESERHRLLASERRRVLLSVLADESTPISLDELATAVAAEEPDSPDAADHTATRVTLHHTHLPQMSHLDIIDYDPTRRQVEL